MMIGMYRRMADSALFIACASGLRVPVAMEADKVTPERAYADARTASNAPVAMQLEGRLAQKPKMEGEGTVLTLVPERFVKARPGYRCSTLSKPAVMIDTEWTLVRIGGEAVVPPENWRAATTSSRLIGRHLELLDADGKVLARFDALGRGVPK